MKRLFGTDGVRGAANTELTVELAVGLGRAAAMVLAEEADGPIVIGRDTRLSGPMLEAALVAGITSVGRDAVSIGIVPTPSIPCVVKRERAAAGIMISASHNPIGDNGIKFFGADGFKLPDEVEDTIEARLRANEFPRPVGTALGRARAAQNFARHYYRELETGAPDLTGLDVVVDGAFGAAYAIVPNVLRKLGASVRALHCENDGSRINVECGATDLRSLQEAVGSTNAGARKRAVGVAFDGDADRVLFVDETARAISGDHVLFALAVNLKAQGLLARDTVVATVMSNFGLERALKQHGIGLLRTPVGDRYVLERMRADGYMLGGEQSGHVIDFRYNTTGDGPRTAITLLAVVAASGATLHELVANVVEMPQILLNVRATTGDVLSEPSIAGEIAQAERELEGWGRLLIRQSGTEPLIRVMAEGSDRGRIEEIAGRVAARIERELARGGLREGKGASHLRRTAATIERSSEGRDGP
ncbi:MAG: phosphoglucosamine mutase [Candidatus Eremiobacteraeota bacterium]|nr:phosphoglucosamine mutase [Candidatus Eremiobacteraeota bacterium]